MNSKITLQLDGAILDAAKKLAAKNHISLGRLMELLLEKSFLDASSSIADFSIASWGHQVSIRPAVYLPKPRSKKALRAEAFNAWK